MSLQYRIIPVTGFQQNCSVIWCDETKKAALVDPGGEADKLTSVLEELGLDLHCLLLTHGHLDHVGAVNELKERFSVPVIGPHKEEVFWLDQMSMQCQMFGFPNQGNVDPDQWLEEGDKISLGNQELTVLFTPGHTPGHVVFYNSDSQIVFVGDVLFAGSIGRTDFPKGHHQTLLNSIREKLFSLDDDVKVIPGHGPMTTIGKEKHSNPFVSDSIFG